MDSKKEILVFFDLEGTIIDEGFGEINNEKVKEILDSLSRLEDATNAKVNIHIVSPIFMKQMEEIIDKIDRVIVRYNVANGKRLKEIQGAVAHPEVKYINSDYVHDKIIPMKLPKNIADGYKDKYGKYDYVRNWIEAMQDSIEFSIYAGNGFNDTKAMEYIKNNKRGFIICPKNSHPEVKKIANYVSEEHAVDGIKEGIEHIVQQFSKEENTYNEKPKDIKNEGQEHKNNIEKKEEVIGID